MTRRRDAHDAQRRMEHADPHALSLRGDGPLVRPYGDTTGDGMVQASFTLPLPYLARYFCVVRGCRLARETSPSKWSSTRWSMTLRQMAGTHERTIIPA